ncbi:MAG TPA: hypothetical protein VGR19_07960 [Allosphingosinicella sp.]|nr:hypothetical protein [Allosphingosinicella sp.]
MAMSRTAILLILAGSSASAQHRQVSADEAMEIHRRTFSAVPKVDCTQTEEREEIVVCGSARSPYRLAVPPEPGQRVAGALPSSVEATKEVTCTNVGHTRGCPSFDILGVALMVGKAVAKKVIEAVAEDR